MHEPLAWIAEAVRAWEPLFPENLENTTAREDLARAAEAGDLVAVALQIRSSLDDLLESREVSVRELVAPSERTSQFLSQVNALHVLLAAPAAVTAVEGFKEQMRAALGAYGARVSDVDALLESDGVLAECRTTAVRAVDSMKLRIFSRGASGGTSPRYHEDIYEAPSHGALVEALAASPADGLHLCLIRDPVHDDFSHFCLGVKDGANVYTLSEETDWAHPLQSRMTRKPSRHLDDRARQFGFPYELLDGDQNAGSAVESRGEASGVGLCAMVPLKDVRIYSMAWLAMVFDRLVERHWGRAPDGDLSYTAERLSLPVAMVEGQSLPVVAGKVIAPLTVPRMTVADVGGDALREEFSQRLDGDSATAWIERRYGPQVPDEVLVLAPDATRLPALEGGDALDRAADDHDDHEDGPDGRPAAGAELRFDAGTGAVVAAGAWSRRPWGSRNLVRLSRDLVGTEKEIARTVKYLARHNYAATIHELAEAEYASRRDEIRRWFMERARANLPTLIDSMAKGSLTSEVQVKKGAFDDTAVTRANIMRLAHSNSRYGPEWFQYTPMDNRLLDPRSYQNGCGALCAESGARASVFARFEPTTAVALADMLGVGLEDLPVFLRHWSRNEPYVGNPILEAIDPVQWVPRDPWRRKESWVIAIALSKRSFQRARARLRLPAVSDWSSLKHSEAVPAQPTVIRF